MIGIPGGSNALATASRLGLSEGIIADARGMLTEGSQDLEGLLANLMAEKQGVETVRHELEKERNQAEQRNNELNDRLQRLKTEERRLIQETRDRIVREAAELHKEIRKVAAELRKEKSSEKVEQARRSLATMREQLDGAAWQSGLDDKTDGETADESSINIGDTVRLKGADMQATVLSISGEDREVEIQAGQTRLRLDLDRVEKVLAQSRINTGTISLKKQPGERTVSIELDLRGKRADEVEPLLDSYLNDASLANLNEARIIHGLATGTVRSIVRDFLSSHSLVKSFRPGTQGEGGDGVTIVRL